MPVNAPIVPTFVQNLVGVGWRLTDVRADIHRRNCYSRSSTRSGLKIHYDFPRNYYWNYYISIFAIVQNSLQCLLNIEQFVCLWYCKHWLTKTTLKNEQEFHGIGRKGRLHKKWSLYDWSQLPSSETHSSNNWPPVSTRLFFVKYYLQHNEPIYKVENSQLAECRKWHKSYNCALNWTHTIKQLVTTGPVHWVELNGVALL